MGRLLLHLLPIFLIASGFVWLSDHPGNIVIVWEDYELKTSLFQGVILFLAILFMMALFFSFMRKILFAPSFFKEFLLQKKQSKGFAAISQGMIALGAEDIATAKLCAQKARKYLPQEPLGLLLEAETALLSQDRPTARRLFEGMLTSPDKELLGLRNLFLLAKQEGEARAAQYFAERAVKINPQLNWSLTAQLELQCKAGDWSGAIESLSIAKKYQHLNPRKAERQIAVLRTAKALELEDRDPETALMLALSAHKDAPDLVPAAVVAAHILSSRGRSRKASKVVLKTWRRFPHPDLVKAYTHARNGDSPHDRLKRMLTLARFKPDHIESAIGIATSALEAREYEMARHYLQPFLKDNLTCRIACLMARIEKEDEADIGRMRAWISRAMKAEPDPAWIADGVILKSWAPLSPLTGQIDAVEWQTPLRSSGTHLGIVIEEIQKLIELTASPLLSIESLDAVQSHSLLNTSDILPHENPQSLFITFKQMLNFHSDKASGSEPTPTQEEVQTSRILLAPDDPGLGGDNLVPEIRTTVGGPKN